MKKVVTFGEIMLRLTPPNHRRFCQASSFEVVYGGGESNVAVSLANFGLNATFVTRLPDNDIGDCALMEMRKRNVNTTSIIRGGERLGIYFLEIGAMSRGSKVVYDRTNSGMATIQRGMIDWKEVFKDADWFHWTGITPALSQGAADTCLEALTIASEMGIPISTDLNYRKNLWNYGKTPQEIMPSLVSKCDIIMGNEEDAKMHFGIHPKGINVENGHDMNAKAYQSVCEQMMMKFPQAKKIIISLRGSISASDNTWSGILYDGSTIFTTKKYNLTHIVDRVGGGDSFMAALIYGILTFDNDQKALDFAVAASALKHSIYGDSNLVSISEVEALMNGNGSGRVHR